VNVEVVPATVTSELRRAVLRPQWPAGARMHGDDDPSAVHLAARDDAGELLGACVLIARPCPARPDILGAWQLRGMATVAQHRGEGVGTALTEAAVNEVRRRGGELVWCDARESAIGFYARRGFTGTGEIYAHPETGAPHLMMYRELSGGPGTSAQ
jgi:ribosomal protein S18 acetylase RimI-like enzyme